MALFSTEGAAGFRRDRAIVITARASRALILKSRRRRFLRRARSGLATSIFVWLRTSLAACLHTVAAVCDRRRSDPLFCRAAIIDRRYRQSALLNAYLASARCNPH